MKSIPGVEAYFEWPRNWQLPSCGACSPELRQPINVSRKQPDQVTKLLVGLNPGYEEQKESQYFIGRAGQWLRSEKYEPLWNWLGAPEKVLITNVVKLWSKNAVELEAIGDKKISDCARKCFCAEVLKLPKLTEIVLLGDSTSEIFHKVCVPVIQSAAGSRARIRIHQIRHPSFCWTAKDFQTTLKEALNKPSGEI